jgi:hypothetical protein
MSTAPSAEQEFPIPVAALDRRRDDTGDAPADRDSEIFNVLANRGVHSRIANDPLGHAFRSGFELRLH